MGVGAAAFHKNKQRTKNNGRTSPKSSGHVPEPCTQEQDAADDISDQRGEIAGYRDVVRQFLRAAAPRRTLATRLQARHIDDHARRAGASHGLRPGRRPAGIAISPTELAHKARTPAPRWRRRAPACAHARHRAGAAAARPARGQPRTSPTVRRRRARRDDQLAEAVGLARAIALDVRAAEIVPHRPAAAIDPAGLGQGRGDRHARCRARGRARHRRSCRQPDPAAQPREGLGLQGARPHRAHPRDLRRARAHARGPPAGGAGASQLPEEPAGALLDPSRAPARRLRLPRRPRRGADRDRPAADRGARRAHPQRPRRRRQDAHAAPLGSQARAVSRWWPSSATPTPASRRCSTASPAPPSPPATRCSRRSTPPCAR